MSIEKQIIVVLPGNFPLRETFASALAAVNLSPIIVSSYAKYLEWLKQYKIADGVLLVGGTDPNPELYGQTRREKTDRPDQERDNIELTMLRMAMLEHMPALCICRGLEMLAIANGGSLIQDIPQNGLIEHQILPQSYVNLPMCTHEIIIEPNSKLYDAYGDRVTVNSMHHQSINENNLPKNLRVTARAPDGGVEAIESKDGLMIGVQFHPEADKNLWEIFSLFSQAVQVYIQGAKPSA